MPTPAPKPDPAASVIVLRAGTEGFEVLMVERMDRGFFGGIVVFPGGGVEAVDESDVARRVVIGEHDDLGFRSAALRELAEETGLAVTTRGIVPAPTARDRDFFREMGERGETLSADSLVLVSRWVTPDTAPRRFDTMFYLLPASSTPQVRLDPHELVDHAWVTPDEALDRYERGEWKMILPTLAHLRWLRRRSSIGDAVASARGADGRTLIKPQRLADGSIVPVHLPAEMP